MSNSATQTSPSSAQRTLLLVPLLLLSSAPVVSASPLTLRCRGSRASAACQSSETRNGLRVRCSGPRLEQTSMPQLDLNPSSLNDIICQTSDLPNLGAVGIPLLLLVDDWDLCHSIHRTTDVVMLFTMFFWFFMLFSYLIFYIRQNQEHARRHMEYIKLLQSRMTPEPDATTPEPEPEDLCMQTM